MSGRPELYYVAPLPKVISPLTVFDETKLHPKSEHEKKSTPAQPTQSTRKRVCFSLFIRFTYKCVFQVWDVATAAYTASTYNKQIEKGFVVVCFTRLISWNLDSVGCGLCSEAKRSVGCQTLGQFVDSNLGNLPSRVYSHHSQTEHLAWCVLSLCVLNSSWCAFRHIH